MGSRLPSGFSALAGGTGGVAMTPIFRTADAYITKADLAEALTPMNAKLEKIETALIDLHAEAAVARYARERRASQ
jgi:hypothetical protein